MAGEQIRKVYLDEDEDFSERQSYGRRVVTPVRYSTDPRDVGWVRQNIPCQTACPADTNVPAYIQMILENRYGRSYELNRIANVPAYIQMILENRYGRSAERAAMAGPATARRSTSAI